MPAETRDDLLASLTEEVRLQGVMTDIADQAVADLMGLNRTDARCLDIIERIGQVTAGGLARESGLSTGAVTTVLDRLERAGLARRVADPADRRRVLAEVTPDARRRTSEIHAPLLAASSEELARYSEAELELLRDFLRRSRALQEEHIERMRGGLGGRFRSGSRSS
jgi:DNA-binding MarR family transcriptional regulator